MGRVRIHAIAKELGVESKDILARLKKLGVEAKTASSSVDEEIIAKLKVPAAESAKPAQAKEAKKAPEKKAAPESKAHAEPSAQGTAPSAAPPAEKTAPEITVEKIAVKLPVTVRELAEILNIKADALIRALMNYGVMANINQSLDVETIEIVAHELGKGVVCVAGVAGLEEAAEVEDPKNLLPRAPVVTFMGHIDHGKTSLLDAIRETKIVDGEAGGITQHIGAYEVALGDKRITFLDTPGHETFTAMRARGATVTDIAVMVVAADDGIMPQTREAVDHARAAKVPILVAVNKIDKPAASPEKVRRQLMELGLTPEEYGGQTICCDVSAITKQGLSHLLEMILLQAEVMELKANPNAPARAIIIEAEMDKGRGAVATALVRRGTLKIGDPIVCGMSSGRVKALFDFRGKRIQQAAPAQPVEVLGLDGVPKPGDELTVVASERDAKRIVEERKLSVAEAGGAGLGKMTLEELYSKIAAGKAKELKLILKGDVQGSIEALRDALQKLDSAKVSVSIIHCAVGDINENDVMLASASDAVIIGFHTRIDVDAKDLSRKESVEIKLYDIIYEVIGDVHKAMEGLLEPAIRETILGRAEVKQLFKAVKGDPVAGSMVIDGKVLENARARVIRGDKILQESSIVSLRRFKDTVKEVKAGMECGIRLINLKDLQEGDIIEAFKMEKVPQKL